MSDKDLLFVMFIVSGITLTFISIPLIAEKIKPNYWYGFRVAKTLNNPEIWYKANKYAGWRLLGAGLTITLSSLLLYLLPGLDLLAYSVISLLVFTGVLTISIFQSFIYLRKL